MIVPAASWRYQVLCSLIYLVLAVISIGCATTAPDSLDAPLPSNLSIQLPDPEVPAHIAGMSGIWTGQMSSGNGFFMGRHALVIQSISSAPVNYVRCNPGLCSSGYGHVARAFMSYRAPWDKGTSFWFDLVIEPDGVIHLGLREGKVKYFLMSPGRKFLRAEWTWRADSYGYSTLERRD